MANDVVIQLVKEGGQLKQASLTDAEHKLRVRKKWDKIIHIHKLNETALNKFKEHEIRHAGHDHATVVMSAADDEIVWKANFNFKVMVQPENNLGNPTNGPSPFGAIPNNDFKDAKAVGNEFEVKSGPVFVHALSQNAYKFTVEEIGGDGLRLDPDIYVVE